MGGEIAAAARVGVAVKGVEQAIERAPESCPAFFHIAARLAVAHGYAADRGQGVGGPKAVDIGFGRAECAAEGGA